MAAWREAYRAFGAKPQRTRNSLEALLRRAGVRAPRVNRLTDLYNAVSVTTRSRSAGRTSTATRARPGWSAPTAPSRSPPTADGPVVEHPEVGEVVWRDDAGVTCRRWNWRQAPRTG